MANMQSTGRVAQDAMQGSVEWTNCVAIPTRASGGGIAIPARAVATRARRLAAGLTVPTRRDHRQGDAQGNKSLSMRSANIDVGAAPLAVTSSIDETGLSILSWTKLRMFPD
jgi:hypothetical protein